MSIGSRGLSAALGLLALPVYVSFLGIEAYGVVGLFASLQVFAAFMDLGLATTLTRELSSVTRERIADGRDLALSFEVAYVAVAVLLGAALVAGAPWVATRWVNVKILESSEVSAALQLGALALACQWPGTLYSAALAGLHRQTELAISTSAFAVVRVALTVFALTHSPSLLSFFSAQVASGLLQTAFTRMQLWRALALTGHRARVRAELLYKSRAFAGGMTAITATSIVLTQVDKVILSYLLPLPDFGVYAVAATLASGLYFLIGPMFSVIYPRLSALWRAGDLQGTRHLYHAGSTAMAALTLPLALVIAFFPSQALFVFTGDDELSRKNGPVLTALILGGALHGTMNMPYAMQLAAGWTRLTIGTNLVAIATLVPLTWWSVQRFGVTGGAVAWLGLNLGYFLCTPQLMHRRLLPGEKLRWYLSDNFYPGSIALGVIAAIWTLHASSASRSISAVQLAAYWALATAITCLALPSLRVEVNRLWKGL